VASTVGHKEGAVAYVRQEWKTPLIFVLKCVAHKISRGWQRSLQEAGGGKATRASIKRQQIGKVKLNRTVLLIEDQMYLIKTCEPVRKLIQKRQQENVLVGRGLIDSRWECTIFALELCEGLTVVMARLQKLYLSAEPSKGTAPTLGMFKAVVDADPWQKAEWWEQLFFERVETGGKGKKKKKVELRPVDLSKQLTLDEALEAYDGPRVLPQNEVLITLLDEEGLSTEALSAKVDESNAAMKHAGAKATTSTTKKLVGIEPPSNFAKATKLTAVKVPGLLWDQSDVDLCMRKPCFEAFGVFHVRPFLHFVCMKRKGIFFEMHAELERHLAVCQTFIAASDDEETLWSTDDIRSSNVRLARALDFAIAHANQLGERHEGASEQACVDIIVEIGSSYGRYTKKQFAEWVEGEHTNPILKLGAVGATTGGADHAKWLVEIGKSGLRMLVGKVLRIMPRAVGKAYDDAPYTDPVRGGPLRLLSETTAECRQLWQDLVDFQHETQPLFEVAKSMSKCVHLAALIEGHYAPLYLATVRAEEGIKKAKGVKPQQALHVEGTEVRLQNHFHTVWEPRMWGSPTPAWLAPTRRVRKEKAAAVAAARKAQRAAPPAEPLRPVVLHDAAENADEPESGDDGDEAEDALAEDEVIDNAGESESEYDSDGDGTRPIPRNELVEGMVCWCWDMDKKKAPYTSKSTSFPVVLLEDAEERKEKIRCMTLTDGDVVGTYVPDDRKQGKHSYLDTQALISLLFYDDERSAPVVMPGGEQRWCDPSMLPKPAVLSSGASNSSALSGASTRLANQSGSSSTSAEVLSAANRSSDAGRLVKSTAPAAHEPVRLTRADRQRARDARQEMEQGDQPSAEPPVKPAAPAVKSAATKPAVATRAETAFVPPTVALQTQRWFRNSCYCDAVLMLWDALQRWAASAGIPIATLPFGLPQKVWRDAGVLQLDKVAKTADGSFDLEPEVDATPQLLVELDLGAALQEWWTARQSLYAACERPSAAEVAAAIQRLHAARDTFRREFEQTASSEEQQQGRIACQMGEVGTAGQVWSYTCYGR
jgi:hypothetical protein